MKHSLYLFLATLVIAIGSPAQASPLFYGEILTSDALNWLGVGDNRLEVNLDIDFDPLTINYATLDNDGAGTGLGGATIPPTKTYTHTFTPDLSVDSVDRAELHLFVLDDGDFSTEKAVLSLDGSVFDAGASKWFFPFLADVLGGEVTGMISGDGDEIDVTVDAASGDFKLVFSALKVVYNGDTTIPAIPEPGAALLFALGFVLTSRRIRR